MLRTFRLYRSARTARLTHELFVLAEGVAVVTALAGLGSFFARGELPRSVLLIFAGLMTVGLWTSRVALRLALRTLRRRGTARAVRCAATGRNSASTPSTNPGKATS